MLVITLLPAAKTARAKEAIRSAGGICHPVSSWADLYSLLDSGCVSIVVLDVQMASRLRVSNVRHLVHTYGHVPVIAYIDFTPPIAGALASLAEKGVWRTIVFDIEDSLLRMRSTLASAYRDAVSRALWLQLQAHVRDLPEAVIDALDDLLARPSSYRSARDLVLKSGMSLSSLYRIFSDAGFHPPKRFVVAARVLASLRYLRDPAYTIDEVAQKLGYGHARILRFHTIAALDATPTELRTGLTGDELVTRLTHWLVRRQVPRRPTPR